MKIVGNLVCARCHIDYRDMAIDNTAEHTGWICDNCKAEPQGLSATNAGYVDAGVLSEQALTELGFEKEPDGMYYERGWVNKDIDIIFTERKINKENFWQHILRVIEVRGEISFKNKLKELLK